MSQPLRLSDSQMDAVMRAAQPLAPNVRVAFLEALAQVLAAQPEIGDGSVHRAIAATANEVGTARASRSIRSLCSRGFG